MSLARRNLWLLPWACVPIMACLLLVVGCPSQTVPECTGDGDCGEGQECVNGVCTDVAPECTEDGDCGEGQTCDDGVCTDTEPECAEDGDCGANQECVDGVCTDLSPQAINFPTSLHATRTGKQTFYEASDGFFTLTGIPYNDLVCGNCHASTYADGTAVDAETYEPSCADCHEDPDNPTSDVADSVCLGCHGRQGAEQNLFSDVHRDAEKGCMECHTDREMHGDGTEYTSFLEEGAMDADCENCHVEGGSATPPSTEHTSHVIHGDKLHCSACHVASVSTCYNCHFESEVAEVGKRFFNQAPRTGFKMLMNHNGKVHTATFQALVHEGETFVAIAPFYGHSISKEDIECSSCHYDDGDGNPILGEYADTGKIVVTSWDAEAEGTDRLVGPTGVIPIPPDWQTALEFAFLDYTGDATDAISGTDNLPFWEYLKSTADGSHIVFGEPLTAEQIEALTDH